MKNRGRNEMKYLFKKKNKFYRLRKTEEEEQQKDKKNCHH